jgi:tetratricopeptide (TPR) repeat protein
MCTSLAADSVALARGEWTESPFGAPMATTRVGIEIQQRAEELCATGHLTEAAQLLSEAISDAATPELWNDWGTVQYCLGQTLEAEAAFRLAVAFDPGNFGTSANLGALLCSEGKKREAIPFLKRALENGAHPYREKLEGLFGQCCQALAEKGEENEGGDSTGTPSIPDAGHAIYSPPRSRALAAPGSYEEWFESVFKKRVPTPGVRVATSWTEDTDWGRRAHNALVGLECEYAAELLQEIHERNIAGDTAEFGIFEGWWINFFWEATERLGLARRIYGFDSFEGLSEPHPEHDSGLWKKGHYACSLEQVRMNVQAQQRPRIKLVKGFFEKSLRGADALLAKKFCYARIDCAIYQRALDCLRYLGPRLADGAILVFDDWPHARGLGEQRAFEEWLPEVPNLDFEFLFYGSIGHFYTRVHHVK